MHRTTYLRVTACLFLMTYGIACGEDDHYSDNHRSEIQYECEQTVGCRGGRGDSLVAEAVKACVDESVDHIDGYSSNERTIWLSRFQRCAAFQSCIYYDCSLSDESFSKARVAQLQYDCMARIACNTTSGMVAAANALDTCVTQTGVLLDIGTPEQRTSFDARFARCNTQQACAYVGCK